MKKPIYLVILLITVSILALSGCKGSVQEQGSTEAPSSEVDFE